MKKIIKTLLTSLLIINFSAQAILITILDRRTYLDKKTNKQAKYPRGLFAGIDRRGQTLYKAVMPSGKPTILNSRGKKVSSIRIYEPAIKAIYQINIDSNDQAKNIVLEIKGFDRSYIYTGASGIKSGIGGIIKVWKEIAPAS